MVPDGHTHQPTPVLQASELQWLTHYVQALNDLEPPLPSRAALSGPRAAGFASYDPMGITVVVDDRHRASLDSRLAQAAAVASEAVPSVRARKSASCLSSSGPSEWTEQHPRLITTSGWLPHTASRRGWRVERPPNGPRATHAPERP